MKKLFLVILIIIISLLMLGALKLPLLCMGTYEVEQSVLDMDYIHEKQRLISGKVAQIIESKPIDLTVDPEIEKLKGLKYASVRLGNNEKDTWFAIGKDKKNYYSEIYVDQDLDNSITIKEKVTDITEYKIDDRYDFLIKLSYTDKSIPLLVSYKGFRGEIKKKLFFHLQTLYVRKDNANDTLLLQLVNDTVLDGTITVKNRKEETDYSFRLVDVNSNGCYNDFNKDYILFNTDSIDKHKGLPLSEYFDFKENGQKKQLQLVVLPYPAKIGVFDSTGDFDPAQFEPESDTWDAPKEEEPLQVNQEEENDQEAGPTE